jgi:hypothetical protein
MLVAELDELRGRGDSPFAGHLAECAACRTVASTIASRSSQLARLVDARSRRRRSTRRVAIVSSLPIAAAIVAGVVLRGRHERRIEHDVAITSLPAAQNVSVDVVPGQQTTVLRTADSTVTVIWLSPGVGQ